MKAPSIRSLLLLSLIAPALSAQTNTPTPLWTPNPVCCLPVTSYGSPGTLLGQFGNPLCLSVAGNVLYVADPGNARVQRLSLGGAPLGALTGSGALVSPFGVKADGNGYLFVTDRNANQVLKIDAATDQVTPVVLPTPASNVYSGVDADKAGGIYVTRGLGFPNGSIIKYKEVSPGVFTQAASIGGFNIPNSCLASDDGSVLYVVDSSNEYIERYLETPPGSNNYLFDTIVVQAGLITWGNQLARDPWGNFYVTDTNNRHLVFDASWSFLYQCQSTATPAPSTYGMALDDSGNLYRGNTAGYIEKFSLCFPSPTATQPPPATPTATPPAPAVHCDQSYAYPNPAVGWTLKLHLQLCQPGRLSLFLYNITGEMVGQSAYDGLSGANDLSLSIQGWAPGVYLYRFEVEDSDGKRHLKPGKFAIR